MGTGSAHPPEEDLCWPKSRVYHFQVFISSAQSKCFNHFSKRRSRSPCRTPSVVIIVGNTFDGWEKVVKEGVANKIASAIG